MKLEDCELEMKVKVLGKTVHGNTGDFPALTRGWGYVKSKQNVYGADTVYLTERVGGPSESGGYSPNDLEPYIEPEETEYRQLKDITPRAIYRAAPTNALYSVADSFMEEFIRFVTAFLVQYDEVIPFDEMVDEFQVEPGWEKWLIQHGFIEKVVEEVTYSMHGELVDDKGEKAVIVQTGPSQVCVIHNCNRWVEPITVKDVTSITTEEFERMNGSLGTWRKDK